MISSPQIVITVPEIMALSSPLASTPIQESTTASRMNQVAQVLFSDLLLPAAVGIAIGTVSFVLLSGAYIEELPKALYSLFRYGCRNTTSSIIQPIFEELSFRGWCQENLFKYLSELFNDASITIFSHKIKLATIVSVIATAIFFGAAHILSGYGFIRIVQAAMSGLAYGVLKEEFGMLAPVAAHIVHNTLSDGLRSYLLSQRF